MRLVDNILYADEGKIFRRIADQTIYGNIIYLGYVYYINEVLQTPPHLDTPADFEEIPIPEGYFPPEEVTSNEET